MANTTCKLYIRTKGKYTTPPKKLTDLPEGSNYQMFWYEGKVKKSSNVGRFADAAQVAQLTWQRGLQVSLKKLAMPTVSTNKVQVHPVPVVLHHADQYRKRIGESCPHGFPRSVASPELTIFVAYMAEHGEEPRHTCLNPATIEGRGHEACPAVLKNVVEDLVKI